MEHEPDDERPLLRSTRLPPAPTAEPRPPDEQGTRGQELRDALEELKADLDGHARVRSGSTPAPATRITRSTPPSASPFPRTAASTEASAALSGERSGRRLALGALAAVVVLAGVPVVVRVVAWSVAGAQHLPPPPSSVSPPPAPAPSPSVPAASTPETAAGGATPSPSPPPQPAGPALVLPPGLPRSGPGADAPGAELTAVLERAGTVVVYERLVVRPGTTSVHLAPALARALPRNLQAVGFTVSDLQVSVDGRAVTASGDSQGWRVTRPDGGPFTQLAVRYRLGGALVRATPAPPGRRTLVLRPITGPQASAAQDPVVVRLRDPRVGQVYCPSAPRPLCDTASGTAHVATVPAGAAPIVLAQVTLP